MTLPGGKAYRPWTPELYAHQAHAPATKLPEDDLVFFLLDVVPTLDLSRIHAVYQDETRGAPPFDPAMMTCLLLYAYCVGVFSSRKIAQACERNLAFLAIVGTERPDFRTISQFRKTHLDAFADVFVQVLRLAQAAGLVRLGTIAVDGTKVQGNASRHKAMSYGYMTKEETRLRAEIDTLLKQAQEVEAADDAALGTRRGDELPDELRRRQDRLAVIQEAKKRLEAEAKAAADAERQRRAEAEAERQQTGKKRRGREPGPIVETPPEKAQTNFTDPELSIMKMANKGWEYCGNAQASVDGTCQIILACEVTDQCNDQQQAAPMAEATRAALDAAGIAPAADATGTRPLIPAALDTGYFSAPAVAALEREGFDPHIATERQRHHVVPAAAPASALEPAATPTTAKERMRAKLATESGRAVYARRKTIVEPVFGQIKEARGFRRFLLRGLAHIRGEWRLVCLTHNLLKIWRYGKVILRGSRCALIN
ncbi:MAG: transposase [Acetobacteraceae bacterium]|nr:transposase [Acetobacteraceae bacterium]